MRRLLTVNAVMFFLAVCAVPATARRKKEKKSNPAAVALFKKALAVSDIEAKGSPAFRLQATVRIFGDQNKHADAVLVQFWAPGDKWREETMMPGYNLVRVSDDKRLWAKSALGYEPFPAYEAWAALGFLDGLRGQLGLRTDSSWSEMWMNLGVNGLPSRLAMQPPYLAAPKRKGNLECVKEMEVKHAAGEYCFDVASGDLVSEVEQDTGIRYEYADYASFGQKSFPKVARVFYATKHEFLEIHVNRIDPLARPSPATFLPAQGSQEEISSACGKTKPPKIVKFIYPSYVPSSFGNQLHGSVVVYGSLGIDGALHGLWPVRSPAPELTKVALSALRRWRYKPVICESGGTSLPVPLVTFISVAFRMEQ